MNHSTLQKWRAFTRSLIKKNICNIGGKNGGHRGEEVAGLGFYTVHMFSLFTLTFSVIVYDYDWNTPLMMVLEFN